LSFGTNLIPERQNAILQQRQRRMKSRLAEFEV